MDEVKLCSCDAKAKVEFECIVDTCPNFTQQKYYCLECLKSFKNHKHETESIASAALIRDVQHKWQTLKTTYNDIFTDSKERYVPIQHLIAYLEEIVSESDGLKPKQSIKGDYMYLSKLNAEIAEKIIDLETFIKDTT